MLSLHKISEFINEVFHIEFVHELIKEMKKEKQIEFYHELNKDHQA